jgi:hypothetical protein
LTKTTIFNIEVTIWNIYLIRFQTDIYEIKYFTFLKLLGYTHNTTVGRVAAAERRTVPSHLLFSINIEMRFLRVITGHRTAGHKRNEHIREELETDITTHNETIQMNY